MKNFVRFRVVCFLIIGLLSLTTPLILRSAATSNSTNQEKKPKGIKVEKGPDVAERVKQLKQRNNKVRLALKAFEDRKQMPKVEESFAFSTKPDTALPQNARTAVGASFQKASLQEVTSSGDGYSIDVLFIPTLSIEREWQGTVVETLYDVYGNYVDQYVADIVMTEPDPNVYSWNVVYENAFWDDGTSNVYTEPGMYSTFELGNPIRNQPALDQSYISKKQQRSASIKKASFQGVQDPCNRQFLRYQDPEVEFRCNQRRMIGAVRRWARCSYHGCSTTVITCAIGNIWNADAAFGGCFAIGCGVSAGYCAVQGFFGS